MSGRTSFGDLWKRFGRCGTDRYKGRRGKFSHPERLVPSTSYNATTLRTGYSNCRIDGRPLALDSLTEARSRPHGHVR